MSKSYVQPQKQTIMTLTNKRNFSETTFHSPGYNQA